MRGHISQILPLYFLFLFALRLLFSAFVSSVSSLISPLPENTSSGASIAASDTAIGATYRNKICAKVYSFFLRCVYWGVRNNLITIKSGN